MSKNTKPIPVAMKMELRDAARNMDEFAFGFGGLSKPDQKKFLDLMRAAKDNVMVADDVEVHIEEKKKSSTRTSRVASMINTIRDELIKYESQRDHPVEVSVDVVGILDRISTDYTQFGDTSVKEAIDKYDQEASKSNFISLLICFGKGKAFTELKMKYKGTFKDQVRRILRLSYESVRRYIEFARVVAKFPRLLVCNQSFTMLTAYLKDIENAIDGDRELGALAEQGLRDIQLDGNPLEIDRFTIAIEQLRGAVAVTEGYTAPGSVAPTEQMPPSVPPPSNARVDDQ